MSAGSVERVRLSIACIFRCDYVGQCTVVASSGTL